MKIVKDFLYFFNKNKRIKNKNILYKNTKKFSSLKKKRSNFIYKLNFFRNFKVFKDKYIPIFFSGFFILILICIGTLFSPIFKLKYIEIIKKDNLTNMDISYKALESIRGKSIFNVEKKDLLKKLQNYQENIKEISLSIKLPNTIKITVGSYKGLFNTFVGGKNYLILENGSFIPIQKAKKELPTINIVNEFGNNSFLDYSLVFEEKHIKKINNIINRFKKNILGSKITKMNFYNIEREFHLEINNYTNIIFSVDDDISAEEQIKNLAILNKEHENINKKNIINIDLRIKGKSFFCKKNEKKECYKNLENLYPKVEKFETGLIKEEKKEKIHLD